MSKLPDNLYDQLSARMFGFNRDLIKRELYFMSYSGPCDPWLANIILTELSAIRREQQKEQVK